MRFADKFFLKDHDKKYLHVQYLPKMSILLQFGGEIYSLRSTATVPL